MSLRGGPLESCRGHALATWRQEKARGAAVAPFSFSKIALDPLPKVTGNPGSTRRKSRAPGARTLGCGAAETPGGGGLRTRE